VSSTIGARIRQHKEKIYPRGVSAKYNCIKLVYYKWLETIMEAIAKEKRIKGESRRKKELRINSMNPEWNDLYGQVKIL
jgi:putative endonuclease